MHKNRLAVGAVSDKTKKMNLAWTSAEKK